MKKLAKETWIIIKNFLFPPQCVFCDKVLEINDRFRVCEKCRKAAKSCDTYFCCEKCGRPIVSFGEKQLCYRCIDHRPKYIDRIVSAYIYDGVVKESVTRYKALGIQNNAAVYARMLKNRFDSTCGDKKFDFICAAPSHIQKKRKQGFDNVELICRHLSKMTGIPFEKGTIIKIRKTAKQTDLKFAERMENLKNSMSVSDTKQVEGKTILLVDDVCTTGATVTECSRALKVAGAKRVFALTFATTVLNLPREE